MKSQETVQRQGQSLSKAQEAVWKVAWNRIIDSNKRRAKDWPKSYLVKSGREREMFQVYKDKADKAGEWRWRLRSRNNKVIAHGEGYKTRRGAVMGTVAVERAICGMLCGGKV